MDFECSRHGMLAVSSLSEGMNDDSVCLLTKRPNDKYTLQYSMQWDWKYISHSLFAFAVFFTNYFLKVSQILLLVGSTSDIFLDS